MGLDALLIGWLAKMCNPPSLLYTQRSFTLLQTLTIYFFSVLRSNEKSFQIGCMLCAIYVNAMVCVRVMWHTALLTGIASHHVIALDCKAESELGVVHERKDERAFGVCLYEKRHCIAHHLVRPNDNTPLVIRGADVCVCLVVCRGAGKRP